MSRLAQRSIAFFKNLICVICGPDVSSASASPLNGKEIWRVSYADGFSNVPRPVFAHGLVDIATGFSNRRCWRCVPMGRVGVARFRRGEHILSG